MDDLPPKIPTELPQMDRLISLLGNLANGVTMRNGVKKEVHELAGVLPVSRDLARRWKKSLMEIRAEMAAEADPEADADPRGPEQDPVAKVVMREGIALNACQTAAMSPASRKALAAVVSAAAQRMKTGAETPQHIRVPPRPWADRGQNVEVEVFRPHRRSGA